MYLLYIVIVLFLLFLFRLLNISLMRHLFGFQKLPGSSIGCRRIRSALLMLSQQGSNNQLYSYQYKQK